MVISGLLLNLELILLCDQRELQHGLVVVDDHWLVPNLSLGLYDSQAVLLSQL